jgi:putative oxidoreductase
MSLAQIVSIFGRTLLAALFLLAGVSKFIDPKPVLAHMAQEHVPGFLLYAAALLELAAGAALIAGWNLRFAAAALSVFCLSTAFLIHLHLSNRIERTQFLKDIALAGSLAVIASGVRP